MVSTLGHPSTCPLPDFASRAAESRQDEFGALLDKVKPTREFLMIPSVSPIHCGDETIPDIELDAIFKSIQAATDVFPDNWNEQCQAATNAAAVTVFMALHGFMFQIAPL
jgi:hypothetical protein